MRIKDLAEIRTSAYSELTFCFDEILLEDLEHYTDDILVDGDTKTLTFIIG